MKSKLQIADVKKPIRVSVVAYNALPVALPTMKGHFGGLETSAWLTAKSLAMNPDFDVRLITRYHRPVLTKTRDNVKIISRWKPIQFLRESLAGNVFVLSHWPYLNVTRFEFSLLWKIPLLFCVRLFNRNTGHLSKDEPFFRKLKCDAFLLFGTNVVSATIIKSLQHTTTKKILFIQSNSEVAAEFVKDSRFRNEYGVSTDIVKESFYGSDKIIVQTAYQAHKLHELYQLDSSQFGNPFDWKDWQSRLSAAGEPSRDYVLWIGRADRFHKRPDIALKVAQQCPTIQFRMIMNAGDDQVRKEIEDASLNNLKVIESVPYSEMPSQFLKASLLLFTGTIEHEGLPNVLLQAAATGKPIIGYDYLPSMITDCDAGVVAGNIENMIRQTQRLVLSDDAANRMGQNGFSFMRDHQTLEIYQEKIAAMLKELVISSTKKSEVT